MTEQQQLQKQKQADSFVDSQLLPETGGRVPKRIPSIDLGLEWVECGEALVL